MGIDLYIGFLNGVGLYGDEVHLSDEIFPEEWKNEFNGEFETEHAPIKDKDYYNRLFEDYSLIVVHDEGELKFFNKIGREWKKLNGKITKKDDYLKFLISTKRKHE